MEHAVEEIEELRTRVGERFRIDPVVSADNIPDSVELGVVARQAVEDQVATRDVALRGIEESAVLETFLAEVVHFLQERQVHAPERPRANSRGEGQHRLMLAPRPPEIVERQRPDVPALLLRHHNVTAESIPPDRRMIARSMR